MKLIKNPLIHEADSLLNHPELEYTLDFKSWSISDVINYAENNNNECPYVYILAKNKIDRCMLRYQLGKHGFKWAETDCTLLDKYYSCNFKVMYYTVLFNKKVRFGNGTRLYETNDIDIILSEGSILFTYKYSKSKLY